jgi:hypothetical protein
MSSVGSVVAQGKELFHRVDMSKVTKLGRTDVRIVHVNVGK